MFRDVCSNGTSGEHGNEMSVLTFPCRWEEVTVRERTGHPPYHVTVKKMKSPKLRTHLVSVTVLLSSEAGWLQRVEQKTALEDCV